MSRLGWAMNKDLNDVAKYTFTAFLGQMLYLFNAGTVPNPDDPVICLPNNPGQPAHLMKTIKVKQKSHFSGLKIFKAIVLVNIISVILMLSIQYFTQVQIYSIDNFKVNDFQLKLQKDKELFGDLIDQLDKASNQTLAMNTTEITLGDIVNTTSALDNNVTTISSSVVSNNITSTSISEVQDHSRQSNSNTIYDTNNTQHEDSDVENHENNDEFAWTKVFQYILLSPLSEEIIFRCIMLTFVHVRIAKYFQVVLSSVVQLKRQLRIR
eukprot:UN02235